MIQRPNFSNSEFLNVSLSGGNRTNVHPHLRCSDTHSPGIERIKFEILRKFVLCLVLVWSFGGNGSEVEVPFTDLSFEQSMQKAFSLEKLVLVNFYTDSCPRCEEMHRTTFEDPKVLAWFDEHVVPVSIDSRQRTDLTERFFSRLTQKSFDPTEPAFVVVSSTGGYLNFWLGYADSDELISFGGVVLNRPTTVTMVKNALSDSKSQDPMKRAFLGDAYVAWGRHKDALREYLWCFDEGHIVDPEFRGVRSSFLINNIANLGKVYPAARTALELRRDSFPDEILNQGIDTNVYAYFHANRMLGDQDKTLQLYKALIRDTRDRSEVISRIVESNVDLFVEHKLYDVIVSNVDLIQSARFRIELQQGSDTSVVGLGLTLTELDKDVSRFGKMETRNVIAEYYLVLLATSQEKKAQEVASLLLEFDDGAVTYHALAEAGLKSGLPIPENLHQAEVALSMNPTNSLYAKTHTRLLYATEKQKQAASVLDEYSTLIEDLTLDMPAEERDVLLNSVERDVSENQSQ